jgi:hypothetical protein
MVREIAIGCTYRDNRSGRSATTSLFAALVVRGIPACAPPAGASVVRVGVLRRVKETIASGNKPKTRMTAADPQTTARVHPPVLSGNDAVLSLGFMNITITTYR